MARQGKIARLPHALRDQVNRRLLDGEHAEEILSWLNSQPQAIATWKDHFEGAEANSQNLSAWRLGGHADWLQQREKVEDLKALSEFALDLARAGGSISEGAAAIAAGQILETLETAAESEDTDLSELTIALSRLRKGDLDRKKLDLQTRRQDTQDRALSLAREKFERQTAEQFLRWARTPEAQAILDANTTQSIKIADLRKLMFGERP